MYYRPFRRVYIQETLTVCSGCTKLLKSCSTGRLQLVALGKVLARTCRRGMVPRVCSLSLLRAGGEMHPVYFATGNIASAEAKLQGSIQRGTRHDPDASLTGHKQRSCHV